MLKGPISLSCVPCGQEMVYKLTAGFMCLVPGSLQTYGDDGSDMNSSSLELWASDSALSSLQPSPCSFLPSALGEAPHRCGLASVWQLACLQASGVCDPERPPHHPLQSCSDPMCKESPGNCGEAQIPVLWAWPATLHLQPAPKGCWWHLTADHTWNGQD
jgi:hypothetical protein